MANPLAMSRAQREAFLAETRVAVISVADPGRAPLTLPVWYGYQPGAAIRFVTGASSRKAELIRKAGRISLCVQTETPPYQYVSVEGPVKIGEPDMERDVRQIALRYLGEQMGEAYLQLTASENEPGKTILICLTPERWNAVDFTKMAG